MAYHGGSMIGIANDGQLGSKISSIYTRKYHSNSELDIFVSRITPSVTNWVNFWIKVGLLWNFGKTEIFSLSKCSIYALYKHWG